MPSLPHLTSCTSTKSNLYLTNSQAAAVNEPALYRLLIFQVPNLLSFFHCLGRTRLSVQVRGFVCLEDHPLSAVRDCLFNIFAATVRIGGCSFIHNLRTRHAEVKGTHLSHGVKAECNKKNSPPSDDRGSVFQRKAITQLPEYTVSYASRISMAVEQSDNMIYNHSTQCYKFT